MTAATGAEVRRVAVIDLGSNSWRLVVFAYSPGAWWKRTDELFETVRIAAGLDATGRLSDDAITRATETLDVFARFCAANRLGAADVHPLATSAIRDSANGPELLARARTLTGLKIETLSGAQEAHLGYVAAVNTTTLTDGTVLDIGGGSLQLTAVLDRHPRDAASFPLGAVRLTERFLPDDGPASPASLRRLRDHVRRTLAPARWLGSGGPRLVGIGGAVRNLAAAARADQGGPDLGVQGYVIPTGTLRELVARLAELPVAERGRLPGIKLGRADIVLAAAVVLEEVVSAGGFDGLETTEAGLRTGAFLSRVFLAGAPEPLLGDVRAGAVRNLALQYEPDMAHAEHVARLSCQMFDSLLQAGLFAAADGERELLWAAAMLHDIGMAVSYDDHHKHSRYLIESLELPGFDPRERALIAQITRYHRKGTARLGAIEPLTRDGDAQLLARAAVILRLAEHLERGRDQSVSAARLLATGDGVDLHLHADGDLTLPRWSVERYGDDGAFERVFGRRLVVG